MPELLQLPTTPNIPVVPLQLNARNDSIHIATPVQRRGKCMSRRSGQNGEVFVKSACKNGECKHPKGYCPKYGRFWQDVPGQVERERICVPLGKVTQTTAERNLRTHISSLGVDSAERFITVNSPLLTFKQQSEAWLAGIKDGSIVGTKTREVMKPATVCAYESTVNWLNDPAKGGIADAVLADFNNGEARKLIARMKAQTPKFSNKTIVTYFQTVQNVIASVKTENGDRIYPRDWNLVFIGLPKIDAKKQNKPAFSASEVEKIVSKAKGQYWVLYALLAGTGLRVGEALGLRVEHILDDCTRIAVKQSVWHGKEQAPKTHSAYRDVFICVELARMLHTYLDGRTEGFVFRTKTGKPLSARNIERDSLDIILEEMNAKKDGKLFHSFRRFRSEVLRKAKAPWQLEKQWLGHASRDISDRYAEGLAEDFEWQRMVAGQVGLGFSLPSMPVVGQLGQPEVVETEVAVAA